MAARREASVAVGGCDGGADVGRVASSWGLQRRGLRAPGGTSFPSILKHLLKGEGVQQNDSLADG